MVGFTVEVFFLNLLLFLRVTEILHAAIFTLLSLKSYKCSHWSCEFVLLLFRKLFNFLVNWGNFFELTLCDQGSTLVQKSEELLIREAKSDIGNSDFDILNNLRHSIELPCEVVFKECFESDNG